MEMLRKAELMVQKKKRQMMNRQIAELKEGKEFTKERSSLILHLRQGFSPARV